MSTRNSSLNTLAGNLLQNFLIDVLDLDTVVALLNASASVNSTSISISSSSASASALAAASASANGKVQLSYKEVVLQEVASLAIVLLCSLIPIIIGSYSTVTKPKNARDPRDDKHVNSNYDPLDMDDLRYLIANMTNLEMIDFAALDMKMVLLMPVFAAVALLGMYYCCKMG